eukprot:1055382-Pelagomonas_calceolata.AAC.4
MECARAAMQHMGTLGHRSSLKQLESFERTSNKKQGPPLDTSKSSRVHPPRKTCWFPWTMFFNFLRTRGEWYAFQLRLACKEAFMLYVQLHVHMMLAKPCTYNLLHLCSLLLETIISAGKCADQCGCDQACLKAHDYIAVPAQCCWPLSLAGCDRACLTPQSSSQARLGHSCTWWGCLCNLGAPELATKYCRESVLNARILCLGVSRSGAASHICTATAVSASQYHRLGVAMQQLAHSGPGTGGAGGPAVLGRICLLATQLI